MAAGGQAAALGVKRRPFAAKIKKLTINTRATPSRAGGGGGGAQNAKSTFHRLTSIHTTIQLTQSQSIMPYRTSVKSAVYNRT